MRKDITLETKERLIPIYEQVEKDFSKFPDIKTTRVVRKLKLGDI